MAVYNEALANYQRLVAPAKPAQLQPPAPQPTPVSAATSDAPEPVPPLPPSVPTDPAQLFTQLTKMRPFNSQFIDLGAIANFVNYYAALSGDPQVAKAAGEVRRDIRNFMNRMSMPMDVIQLNNLTTDRFKSLLKNPSAGQLGAGDLNDILRISGALYQQFQLAQKDRLSPDDLRGMQQQVTPGGPEQTNLSDLSDLQQNLQREWANHR